MKHNLIQTIHDMRSVNCMGKQDFIRAWGKALGEHLWEKQEYHGKIKFLFWVDDSNLETLGKYLDLTPEERRKHHE